MSFSFPPGHYFNVARIRFQMAGAVSFACECFACHVTHTWCFVYFVAVERLRVQDCVGAHGTPEDRRDTRECAGRSLIGYSLYPICAILRTFVTARYLVTMWALASAVDPALPRPVCTCRNHSQISVRADIFRSRGDIFVLVAFSIEHFFSEGRRGGGNTLVANGPL